MDEYIGDYVGFGVFMRGGFDNVREKLRAAIQLYKENYGFIANILAYCLEFNSMEIYEMDIFMDQSSCYNIMPTIRNLGKYEYNDVFEDVRNKIRGCNNNPVWNIKCIKKIVDNTPYPECFTGTFRSYYDYCDECKRVGEKILYFSKIMPFTLDLRSFLMSSYEYYENHLARYIADVQY